MKRILHIDDEPEIREILAACLQSQGYEVLSVATPTEAFQAIVWHLLVSHPDLKAAPTKWEAVR